jgi:hypothetical protein
VPGVTVLVLDDGGTVSIAESGNRFPALNPYAADLPPGLTCSQLLEPGGEEERWDVGLTPAQRFFATVAYWFFNGRMSALLEGDQDLPCQTRFPREAGEQIRSGGWITP